MTDSILEGLRSYLAECPLLAEIPVKDRHVNWTAADRQNYGIFTDSNEPIKERAFTKAREDGNIEVAEVFGEQANSIKLAIGELDEIIGKYSAEMEEYESLFSSQKTQGGGTNPFMDFVNGQIASASKIYTNGMQTIP